MLDKREQTIVNLFKDVENFNRLAAAPHSYQTVLDKLKIVLEEVYEAIDAVGELVWDNEVDDFKLVVKENVDKKGLLDGVVDVLYTTFALPRELEALNYDVTGAIQAVSDNNNTKFPTDIDIAEESVAEYKEQGIDVKFHLDEQTKLFVLKDNNGKIRKPVGFKSVCLDEYLPKQ